MVRQTVENAPQEIIGKYYASKHVEDVRRMLAKHTDLVTVLQAIYPRIEAYFPEPAPSLEVFVDTEGDDSEQLVVSVTTKLTPKEAVKQLQKMDEDWALEVVAQTKGLLCLTIKYS